MTVFGKIENLGNKAPALYAAATIVTGGNPHDLVGRRFTVGVRFSRWRILQKIYPRSAAAPEGHLFDGMTIMSGGFGLSGNPESLIPEIRAAAVKELVVISNNAGADGLGFVEASGKPTNPQDDLVVGRRQQVVRAPNLSGELELELNPRGTLAERIRAGGAVNANGTHRLSSNVIDRR